MTDRLILSLSRKESAIANEPPGREEEGWRIPKPYEASAFQNEGLSEDAGSPGIEAKGSVE